MTLSGSRESGDEAMVFSPLLYLGVVLVVLLSTSTEIWLHGNLRKGTCIVHDSASVCGTKRLTYTYASLETLCTLFT